MSLSLLYWGAQNWKWHSGRGLTSGEKRGRILLSPAVSALPNAAQGPTGHLYGQGHIHDSCLMWCLPEALVLFCWAASTRSAPRVLRLVSPWVKDLAFLFVELPELPVSPFQQTSKEPLDGSTILLRSGHPSQLHTTSSPDEGTLCSITQIISEDVEQGWT